MDSVTVALHGGLSRVTYVQAETEHPVTDGSKKNLWRVGELYASSSSKEFWDLYCSGEADFSIVAVDGPSERGDLVGFLRIKKSIADDRVCLICRGIWVLPSHRNLGIGLKMAQQAVAWNNAVSFAHGAFTDEGHALARALARTRPKVKVVRTTTEARLA